MSETPSPPDEANSPGRFQLATGIVLLALTPLLGSLSAPIHRPTDEGQLPVYPDWILRVSVPSRDFRYSWEGWRQPNGSMRFGGAAPVAVRDEKFEVVDQHGHGLVHARKDREPLETSGDLPL